jgi:hypothetical protein
MGYSSYSTNSYRNTAKSFETKSSAEIFNNEADQTMIPFNMSTRECRDSENHPNAIPIIIGLDVTGSMGYIPEQIIKHGLGHMIEKIIAAGISDPAICFVAVGDQFTDYSPLQVGQFESGDQELVMWLQRIWLEGHGGGTTEESYQLVWEFANKHVITDQWEKRKQKGIIITIGDEKPHNNLLKAESIFGGQVINKTTEDLLKETRVQWEVFHIHANDGSYPVSTPRGKDVVETWSKLLKQGLFIVNSHTDIPDYIAKIVSGVILPENTKTEISKDTDTIHTML